MDKQIQVILKNLAEIFYEKFIKDFENGKLLVSKNKLKPVKVTRYINKKGGVKQ